METMGVCLQLIQETTPNFTLSPGKGIFRHARWELHLLQRFTAARMASGEWPTTL